MANYSVISLYSGSKGNSVLIESASARILIDAGKSARSLCAALVGIGRTIDDIDAIFITHEHTDHVGSLEVLLKKHAIPVHIVSASAERMTRNKCFFHEELIIRHAPVFSVCVGNMTVTSFPTPHDSEFSVGYRIEVRDGESSAFVGYATDIGHVTDEIKSALAGCESIVLEANHDVGMLMDGPYPYDLKLRIRSDRGHLSNEDCAALSKELCAKGTRNILLAHLSEENNVPTLAYNTVSNAIADAEVNLKVASQYETVKLL